MNFSLAEPKHGLTSKGTNIVAIKFQKNIAKGKEVNTINTKPAM